MTKIKRDTKRNITILSNTVVRDDSLSWKARGLFLYLWSLPEDWDFYEKEITKHAIDGKDSTSSGLHELERKGYLSRERERNEQGQVKSSIWTLHENPVQRKPKQENPAQADPQLLNTNLTKHLPDKTRTKDIGQVDKLHDQHPSEKENIPYKEIIQYLNKKTGRSFKIVSKTNQKFIRARWHEGYRVDDFKTVINNKVFDWAYDSKMSKFLRPETLFGNKFDSYLQENVNASQSSVYDLDKLGGDPRITEIPDEDLPF